MDETNGMVVGFWKQRAGIVDDATGREYEILGIGGSLVRCRAASRRGRARDRLAARLVRPRLDRAHVPGDRRAGQGAAAAARPDALHGPSQPGHYRLARPALDGLAAAGGGR